MATKRHNEKAKWINNISREIESFEEGGKAEIHTDLLRKTLKMISKWKKPGHDGIHGFCFKKFPSIHNRLSLGMNKGLQNAYVLQCVTLIKMDLNKRTAKSNYRPMTCLPMM